MANYLYQGNVRVYLEGYRALLPTSITTSNIKYYIGSDKTNLVINDYRKEPISAANKKLVGDETLEFADVFNQPAWIEVNEDDGKFEINMYECSTNGEYPMLWMGVIRDNKMPAHHLAWEILRAMDQSAIAFAALVDE